MWRNVVLVVLVSGTCVAELRGQESLSATLKPGQTVRVRTPDGAQIVAAIDSLRSDPLALWLAGQPSPFDAAAVDSLWRKVTAVGSGAAIGAGVAGGLSLAFWTFACHVGTGLSGGEGCDAWGTVVLLSLGGAVGGGLIGAAIGSAVPKWRLLYVRETALGARLEIRADRSFVVALRF